MRRLSLFAAVLVLSACPTPAGSEGPAGPDGARGESGATGPQGPAGPQGVAGAAGTSGATGASGAPGATGPVGPAGPQGLQGPQGAVLIIDGGVLMGPPGSSVVVTPVTAGVPCARGGIRVTQLSDGGITHVCNGVDGAQGPVGAPGASVSTSILPMLSPQCATGGLLIGFPDGGSAAVCNGATGSAGPVGASGSIGPAGAAGPVGGAGPAGGTGPQGPAGPTGTTGATGPVGAPGPTGPAGAVLYVDGGVLLVNGSTASSSEPQLVGYTTFTSNANLGGRTTANARCGAEFPGAHVCNENEFRLARSSLPLPAAAAWLDYASSAPNEPAGSSPCTNFTAATSGWTTLVALPAGYSVTTSTTFSCASVLPIACCTTPNTPRLRGYTAFVSNANLGGRTTANGRCSAEFAGAHVCNENEFRLARSSLTMPAAAAWLDYASSAPNEPAGSSPCTNFTASTPGWTTLVALAAGYSVTTSTTFSCASVLPLACCSN